MTAGLPDDLDACEGKSGQVGRIGAAGPELRRLTLDSLRRADGPLPLARVACHVADAERDEGPPSASQQQVQRVYLAPVRYEVPRLERRGVVEYSTEDGTLELLGPGTP